MNALMELLRIVFASVALFEASRWVFKQKWMVLWKLLAIGLIISLGWAIVNGPLKGRWGADHGIFTDILASAGLVLLATWIIQKYKGWKQQMAAVAGAIGFLALMWVPRYLAGELDPSRLTRTSASASSDDEPDTTSEPARPASARRTRSSGHTDTIDCDALSPDGRRAIPRCR